MIRKRSLVSRDASSRVVDDFKVIRGIGPLYEKHLHDAGIRTFAQLARLSPEDVAACIPKLSMMHLRNQGWILQARKLAGKKTGSKLRKVEKPISTTHQHYENFTFEFLMNEKNKIRRLRITHIQSGDVDTWASWCPKDISQFLARHTGARILDVHTTSRKNIEPSQANKKKDIETTIVDTSPLLLTEPTIQASQKPVPSPSPVEPIRQRPVAPIHLLKWITSLPDTNQSIQSLPQDKTFDVILTLDISKAFLSNCAQLDVTGMLFAKKLGSGSRQVIGEVQCAVPYAPVIDLNIENTTLEQGLYRLEALIKFKPAESVISIPKVIDASFQGGLLQVY